MKAKTILTLVLTAALLPLLGAALAQEPDLTRQVDAQTAPAPQQDPVDCLAIHFANPVSGDGYYTIDPDGAGGNPALEAYCDMSTEGGGWTIIDYNHASGWQTHFTSWQVFDDDRMAMPTAESSPSPSYLYWTAWFTPAEPDTRFRLSPLCQEVTPTLSLAQAYATTGDFYGCTWYNRNCDMEPVTQECYACVDNWGQYRAGACSHLVVSSDETWNAIYEGYPYRCSGDWWNRTPAVGLAGQYCVAYRTGYLQQVFLPLVVRQSP